jgi:hypothetical protein
MFTLEDRMNVLKEFVHKMWKLHSEQLKLEKSSFEGHLLLLQLNDLHRLLSVSKLFTVQFEVIVLVQIEKYWVL